jgi:hypothetical protein
MLSMLARPAARNGPEARAAPESTASMRAPPPAVPRSSPHAVCGALGCAFAQLVGESCLSDAGLPCQEEEPPAPGRQRVEAFEQQLELALTADHRMRSHARKLRRAGLRFNDRPRGMPSPSSAEPRTVLPQ